MANPGASGGGPPLPPYVSPNFGPSIYRRSSYAAVLAGSAAAHNNAPSHTASRSYLATSSASPYPPVNPSYIHSRSSLRGVDAGDHYHSMAGSRGREGNSWSGPFGMGGANLMSMGTGSMSTEGLKADSRPSFFIPSYLRGSRHAERLEEAHKASAAAARENGRASHNNSNAGSLSTSSSSVNLHKMSSSHRGLASEIVERAPPTPVYSHDGAAPLPTRWNEHDKFAGLDVLPDGLGLKFGGLVKSTDEAAAVRADHPMPRQCGIYYYEVTLTSSKSKEGSLVSIGFSGPNVPMNRLPGWEPESWGYHGDDGLTFCSTSSGKPYGPKYHAGDVIGCGVNFRTGCAFFTKNGNYLGTAFKDVRGDRIYPAIGMKKINEQLRVNFGQARFVYDIDKMVERERYNVMQEIEKANPSQLYPQLSEKQIIHRLVAQYLAHDGYVETARAFAGEVRNESTSLENGQSESTMDLEPQEDIHAVHRQRIRTAILDGDIDHAIALTETHYPTVLHKNEDINFKLRCRKYVEMIRRATEPQEQVKYPSKKAVALHTDYADVFDNHQMDLDDQPSNNDSLRMLDETIMYGQQLKSDFSHDPRREVKKALEDTLALIAYDNPRDGPLRELLDDKGRIPVAEELNSAILVSLGKSSCAVLERLIQQTDVLLDELSADGGPGAFVNANDFLR